ASGATAPTAFRRLIVVVDPLRVRAARALELRLDPVDGRAVAIGPLTPIAELRQSVDRGLVLVQIEPLYEDLDRVVGLVAGRPRRGRGTLRAHEGSSGDEDESCPYERVRAHGR